MTSLSASDYDARDLAIAPMLRKSVADKLTHSVFSLFKVRHTDVQNIATLTSTKFQLDSLEKCAEFLSIPLDDANEIMMFTNKNSLATRIVAEIKAYYPSTCQDCSQGYQVVFDDDETAPLYNCFKCFRGSHNCNTIKERHEALKDQPVPTGLVWLCNDCYARANPVKPPKRARSRAPSANSSEKAGKDKKKEVASDGEDEEEEETEEEEEEEEEEAEIKETKPPDDNKTPLNTGGRENPKSSAPAKDKGGKEKVVCQQYKMRKCPHGADGKKKISGSKCPDYHPRRCRKFCLNGPWGEFGCSLGKDCPGLHPILCRYSMKERRCTTKNCTFTHLKGTKRHPSSEDAACSQRSSGKRPRDKKEADEPKTSPNPKPDVANSNFLELMGLIQVMRKEVTELKLSVFQRPAHNNLIDSTAYNMPHQTIPQPTQTMAQHNPATYPFHWSNLPQMNPIQPNLVHQSY